LPSFLTLLVARWKEDADDGTGGVDAASVFTVEEGARASTSTGEISDLSIESGFTQRRHLLANPWLAQNILFENINEFAATTSTATVAFVGFAHWYTPHPARARR
jgi:hypothetical protein